MPSSGVPEIQSGADGAQQGGIRIDDEAGGNDLYVSGQATLILECLAKMTCQQERLDLSSDATADQYTATRTVGKRDITRNRSLELSEK